MTGHSRINNCLSDVLWADAEFQSISIDYDTLALTILESTGVRRTVRCEGYVGYSMRGFWDEIVIERAELVDNHEAINRCTEELARRGSRELAPSGNGHRNANRWLALIVHFSDGATLEIVAALFV
jgi:hypothetical protein